MHASAIIYVDVMVCMLLKRVCTGLRVDDVGKASAVVADMRKIIRQDPRIIQKLHRRVFIDKLTREQVREHSFCNRKCLHTDPFCKYSGPLTSLLSCCLPGQCVRLLLCGGSES